MSLKRLLAVFLALCLFASFLPAAIASDIGEQTENDEPKDQTEIAEDLKEEPEPEPESEPESEPEPEPEPVPVPLADPDVVLPEETVTEPENQTDAEKEKPSDTPAEEKEPVFTEIPEEEIHAVCSYNDTGYQTLQEAVNAAGEQDADIYLYQTIEEDVEIGRNQSITISLNGCGFSGEMVNYGNLTILGEGFFDGVLITRAYHVKDGDTAGEREWMAGAQSERC